MTRGLGAVLLLALAGCDGSAPATLIMDNPAALTVDCSSVPAELSARLWVSGYREAFLLSFDAEAGTTSGAAEIAPGVVRRLTVDWYVPLERADGIDLVLAQARGELSLVDAVGENAELTIDPESVLDSGCLDMRRDSYAGAPTVKLDGDEVPVCDLDDSCAGGDPAACSNLVESCSGSDPLDRAMEPS